MREFEVDCTSRPRSWRGHQHITHVGHEANAWRMSSRHVIRRIDAEVEAFYVVDPVTGRRSYLGVVREAGQPPYLRAHHEHQWNDELLRLRRCSALCDLVLS